MANYSTSEILNEMARIFRARIEPGREGGTLNTQVEYQQLLEISSLTFLLQNDSIFYLAFLASNKLASLVNQEIDLIEDILVSLEDLGRVGKEVTDTATLSNASTALLSLDAAGTVTGRPETTRFNNLMDRFASQYQKNVVSSARTLVRPKEDARNIIQTDLARLKTVHDRLLTAIFPLRDILETFVSLDIPTRVSTTALTSIRENLDSLSDTIDESTTVNNIARSRKDVLTALASKTAVRLISEFTDPSDIKIRSPNNPIPSTAKHYGRVTGEGDSATVISNSAPWDLPVSASLDLSVNGGATQSVPVNEISGSTLNGRNNETFDISSSNENLHVVVDPNTYRATVSSGGVATATLGSFVPLGFKHLGAPISFQNFSGSPIATDYQPRVISDLDLLQSFTITTSTDLGDERFNLIFTGWGAGSEGAVGLGSRHVGGYIQRGPNKFEILEVISANEAIVAVPEIQPIRPIPGVGSGSMYGCIPAISPVVVFNPSLSINASGIANVGAAVKTVKFSTSATASVADLIDDVENLYSNQDPAFTGGAVLQTLAHHVRVLPVSGDPTRLALYARSFLSPHIQISSTFLRVAQTAGDVSVLGNSAHDLLGFREGELDTNKILTAGELAGAINDAVSDVLAEVETTELYEGSTLTTNQGAGTVSDASVDFNDLVIAGDQIEIITGVSSAGTYKILTVGTNLTLDGVTFPATETGLTYRLFREQVQISTVKRTRGSSLEVISGPTELGFTTGEQLGSIPQFEAIDKLGNKLDFTGIVEGDLLRIVGSSTEYEVTDVQDQLLGFDSGLPSDTEGVGFEIRSSAAKDFETFNQSLDTFTNSRNLLPKNGFDENLDEVDAALTRAVLPGQNFASSRNQAKTILAELLALMTDSPRRSDEYTANIPTASINLETLLASYLVEEVVEVDRLIESFQSRKYDRAVNLLTTARIDEFYATTEETGSYGGAVLNASKLVDGDLPPTPTNSFAVDQDINLAQSEEYSPDANDLFDDTDDLLDIPE